MKRISLDIFRIGKTKDERKTRFEQSNEDRVNMNFKRLQQAIEEVNTEKAESGDTYTKAEADALLSDKADKDNVYTKAQSDSLLSEKANSADVVPKSGGTFTGDVAFDGVLDVTQRRCFALLASAGWYRAVKINAIGSAAVSFAIDIDITREYSYANNEVHSIKLLAVYSGNVSFVDEQSKTAIFGIDKIRYTIDASGNGYIDVHYSLSVSNGTTVDFKVHTRPNIQGWFVAESLQAVADAPSGETVLTTYEFAANTVYHDEAKVSGLTHVIDRMGNVVTVTLHAEGQAAYCTSNTQTTIYTIQSGYRPKSDVYFVADAYGANVLISGTAKADGSVVLIPVNGDASWYRMTFTYIV